MSAEVRANELLKELGDLSGLLDRREADYLAQVKDLEQAHASLLHPLHDRLQAAHDELIKLMQQNKKMLFAKVSRVVLPGGTLLYERGWRVTIPRNAVERCEEHGLTEAVKIAKSIDRGVVEKWPDDRLEVIGAKRKPRDVYGYEVKGP